MGGKRVGADGKEDGVNDIPQDVSTRVRIPQRIVAHVAVAVQALRVARVGLLPRQRGRPGGGCFGLGKAGEGEGGVAGLAGRGLCGWEGAGRWGRGNEQRATMNGQ